MRAAPQLIPRLKAIINANYPATKLAITDPMNAR
jgi:hypothetical protein